MEDSSSYSELQVDGREKKSMMTSRRLTQASSDWVLVRSRSVWCEGRRSKHDECEEAVVPASLLNVSGELWSSFEKDYDRLEPIQRYGMAIFLFWYAAFTLSVVAVLVAYAAERSRFVPETTGGAFVALLVAAAVFSCWYRSALLRFYEAMKSDFEPRFAPCGVALTVEERAMIEDPQYFVTYLVFLPSQAHIVHTPITTVMLSSPQHIISTSDKTSDGEDSKEASGLVGTQKSAAPQSHDREDIESGLPTALPAEVALAEPIVSSVRSVQGRRIRELPIDRVRLYHISSRRL